MRIHLNKRALNQKQKKQQKKNEKETEPKMKKKHKLEDGYMSSWMGRENSVRQLGHRRTWLLPDIDAHCRMHLRWMVQPQGGRRNLTLASGAETSHHCGPCNLVNSQTRGSRDSWIGLKCRAAGAEALAMAAAEESMLATDALQVGQVAWRASH